MNYFVFFYFFFIDSPNLAFACFIPSWFASLFSFGWLNSSVIFAAALIIEIIFGWVLSWLLTIFTKRSSLFINYYWLNFVNLCICLLKLSWKWVMQIPYASLFFNVLFNSSLLGCRCFLSSLSSAVSSLCFRWVEFQIIRLRECS